MYLARKYLLGTLCLRRLLKATWSSEPREGLATCTATGVQVPPFLSYFKTLSIGPAPGIEPRPPALQSNALRLS